MKTRAAIATITACLVLFVPRAHGENRVVKIMNEQLGKTLDQIEQGWGGPGHLWIPDDGEWKGQVIFHFVDKPLPIVIPGVPERVYSNTTTTTTGGPRTITMPTIPGIYGMPDTPGYTITRNDPQVSRSTTTTTVRPAIPGTAFHIQMVYLFFIGNLADSSKVEFLQRLGSDRVVRWVVVEHRDYGTGTWTDWQYVDDWYLPNGTGRLERCGHTEPAPSAGTRGSGGRKIEVPLPPMYSRRYWPQLG